MSININHPNEDISTSSSEPPTLGGQAPLVADNATVSANSSGNISRWVMSTAVGGATTEDGANTWAKIATFTPPATNYVYAGFTLSIQDGFQGQTNSSALVSLFLTQNTAGLSTTDSDLLVESIDGGTRLSHDSFKLVSAAATNGTAIDLYINKKTQYGKFFIQEISRGIGAGSWTIAYNNSAAWQSTTPTGAVNITSDWAGSGQLSSTSVSNSTGTVYYEKSDDGFVTVDFEFTTLTTTTDGTAYFTMPAGYRHNITGLEIESVLTGNVAGGIAGRLRMDSSGVVFIYAYVASTGVWRCSLPRYRARA